MVFPRGGSNIMPVSLAVSQLELMPLQIIFLALDQFANHGISIRLNPAVGINRLYSYHLSESGPQ